VRSIVAEQVALAQEAADELEAMGRQILDPPHIANKYRDWAFAVRFVIENFGTAEKLAQSYAEDLKLRPKQIGPPPNPPKPPTPRGFA